MSAAPRTRRSFSLYDLRVRAILYQVLLVLAVGLVAWFLISNTTHNLEQRKIASGFGFLDREAGFAIGETTLIAYNAADSYLRALTVGVLNTFRVSPDRHRSRHSARHADRPRAAVA